MGLMVQSPAAKSPRENLRPIRLWGAMSAKKKLAKVGPSLVFFEDRGTVYDAPLEVVWDFMLKDETFHPQAHTTSLRNFEGKPLSDVTNLITCEVRKGGKWRRLVSRLTTIRPAVRIAEELEGPYAGSKMVFVYTPRGSRTIVDVLCYMRSLELTPEQIEVDTRRTLANAFREDAPWFRKYARSRKSKG